MHIAVSLFAINKFLYYNYKIMGAVEASRHNLAQDSGISAFLNRNLRKLVPHAGDVPLSKRLTRPESYRQVLAEVRDLPKWRRIRACLDDYTERNGGFFFVQLGAHDGVAGDPIRRHVIKHGWHGLLVEPVPHVFERLRANYAGQEGLEFDNVAVSDRNGTATMLAGIELPNGARNPLSSMSSLHPNVVQKHGWLADGLDGLVQTIDVPTVTLPTLMEANGVEQIDGLFVDTEGHDKVILDQLCDLTHLPRFILFEHTHLSRQATSGLEDSLSGLGYGLTTMRRDIFAER